MQQNNSIKFKDTNCDICGSGDSKSLLGFDDTAYHICTNCGLIYSKPMPCDFKISNEDFYSSRLNSYVSKIEKRRKKNQKKLRQFSRHKKTNNFLEIGCNAGATLTVARDMGWNAKGVDLAEAAGSYAREKLNLDVFTGNIEDAGYPDNYFDVIYTNATLEHVRHPLSLLKECRRILRPGGVFYADTVNWDSYTRRLLGANWKLLDPILHIHLYTPFNILSLCKYANLEHIKTWTTGARVKPGNSIAFHCSWYWNLLKGPLSFLTRFTNKGDSIEFLARKSLN